MSFRCSPKFHSCKLETCKQLLPMNPCSRMQAGAKSLRGKHYHCTNCKTGAENHKKCTSCERTCSCSKCNTCDTGSCCHTGVTVCKVKDCEAEICRKCVTKVSATGKASQLCAKHSGNRSAYLKKAGENKKRAAISNEQILAKIAKAKAARAAALKQSRKRKRCTSCDGSERPEKARFHQVNGVFYCGPCYKINDPEARRSETAASGSSKIIEMSDSTPAAPTVQLSDAVRRAMELAEGKTID